MKKIITILFLVGLFIVGLEIGRRSCEESTKVVYKFIPRTPEEEADSPVDVEDIFRDMFQKSTPWIKSSQEDEYTMRKVVF